MNSLKFKKRKYEEKTPELMVDGVGRQNKTGRSHAYATNVSSPSTNDGRSAHFDTKEKKNQVVQVVLMLRTSFCVVSVDNAHDDYDGKATVRIRDNLKWTRAA